MASKAKTSSSTYSTQPGEAVEERERLLHSVSEQETRERAFEIYLQHGAQPGYELEDWLQAERELARDSIQLNHKQKEIEPWPAS
jgi:hypothetical protein